jgi:hypothetical protein
MSTGKPQSRESVSIGGRDYTDTDTEARAIMAHLADQGITESTVARTPYRELVNIILRARQELEAARQRKARETAADGFCGPVDGGRPMTPRPELVQAMADQAYMDLCNDVPDDEVSQRMMAVGLAALTGEEQAMREISRTLYLYAAAGRALVRVGLKVMPAAGTA